MKFTLAVNSVLLGLASTATAQGSTSKTSTRKTTYDYIIAGAGASGLVVAERLADAGHSVLLVERGGPSCRDGQPGRLDEWCRDIGASAGCLLGGSTMLNALMYVKPRAADFEAWPRGWRWDDGVSDADG
ncbi:hypothetical protein NM208_g15800 [Fusarium decemcellulare]|uniref:Uncharacterized protein n=1 Tax=Fusarium decemcellulare TaxID=57161 RepID=A0ACC1RC00_9HYPO|nr:hypothetical protein NM208_g15800 [Fusarium decemcellulare]